MKVKMYEVESIELIHFYDIVVHLKDGDVIEGDMDTISRGSIIYGMVLNPRLYYDGDMEGELKVVDEANAHYVFTPREGTEKERILHDLINEMPVPIKDVVPYGKWSKWSPISSVWENKEWVPVALSLSTSVLTLDLVRKETFDKVNRGETIPLDTDVKTIGDLMYPVYYRKVENQRKWFDTHLPSVTFNTYKNGLINFIRGKREEKKLSTRDLSKEEEKVEMAVQLIRTAYPAPEMVTLKFDYVSYYMPHEDFVHAVTIGLMDALYKDKGMDFVKQEDYEYMGEYKSPYFHYLKLIRGLEKEEDYGVWEL